MDVRIDVEMGGALAALDLLQADVLERAAVSAVNKTVAIGKTRMIRAITRRYNVSAGYVRERLRIERAKYVKGSAQIAAVLSGSGTRGEKRSANLIAFVEKTVSLAAAKKRRAAGEGGSYMLGGAVRQKALELRFKIKRGAPAKVIPGAFIGNKGRTVFIRVGKSRLPMVLRISESRCAAMDVTSVRSGKATWDVGGRRHTSRLFMVTEPPEDTTLGSWAKGCVADFDRELSLYLGRSSRSLGGDAEGKEGGS
jgi:hypothetical protein